VLVFTLPPHDIVFQNVFAPRPCAGLYVSYFLHFLTA